MILDQIKGKLIVSCQALENEPLHSSFVMGKMAEAVCEGGAAGIRANSVSDIKEIEGRVNVPIIGIIKADYPDSEIYITPTKKEILELCKTKVEIIALDATNRKRPFDEKLVDLVTLIHQNNRLAMADISTLEEGIKSAELGFDLVSTTLSGYTDYSRVDCYPNYRLLEELLDKIKVPIILEGHVWQPEEASKALELGAFSVVVGSAITRPQLITERYVNAIGGKQDE